MYRLRRCSRARISLSRITLVCPRLVFTFAMQPGIALQNSSEAAHVRARELVLNLSPRCRFRSKLSCDRAAKSSPRNHASRASALIDLTCLPPRWATASYVCSCVSCSGNVRGLHPLSMHPSCLSARIRNSPEAPLRSASTVCAACQSSLTLLDSVLVLSTCLPGLKLSFHTLRLLLRIALR